MRPFSLLLAIALIVISASFLISFSKITQKVTETSTEEQASVLEPSETLVSKKTESLDLHTFDSKSVRFRHIYNRMQPAAIAQPKVDAGLIRALEYQLEVLSERPSNAKYIIGDLSFTVTDLKRTVESLRQIESSLYQRWTDNFEFHQIWGRDGKGSVKFTAYYTPIIKASFRKEGSFQFPFYVSSGGTSVGYYAQSRADIRNLRLQGSGFVEVGKERIYISMTSGTVRHYGDSDLASVEGDDEPMLIKAAARKESKPTNAFTFVKNRLTKPSGAAGVPLLADYSIAVDSRYIPIGSCLLALVPVNEGGKTKFVYRFLLAQDTGGAIKGAGHVDLYKGIGEKAEAKSIVTNHNGKLWLMLPKKR